MQREGCITMTKAKLVALCGSEPSLPLEARLRVAVDGTMLQEMKVQVCHYSSAQVRIYVPDTAVFLRHSSQHRKYTTISTGPPLLLQVDLRPLPQDIQLILRKTQFDDLFGGTPPALPMAVQLRVSVLGAVQQGMEHKACARQKGPCDIYLEVEDPDPGLEALLKAHSRRTRAYSLVSAMPAVLQVDLAPRGHVRIANMSGPAADASASGEGMDLSSAQRMAAALPASGSSTQAANAQPRGGSHSAPEAGNADRGHMRQPHWQEEEVGPAATGQQQQRQKRQQDSAVGRGEGSRRAGPREAAGEQERELRQKKKRIKGASGRQEAQVAAEAAEELVGLDAAQEEKRARKRQRRLRREAERAAKEAEGGRESALSVGAGVAAAPSTAATAARGWSAGTVSPAARGLSTWSTWSRKNVGSWLHGMGAEELVEGFRRHKIDGGALEGLFLISFDQMAVQVELMCGPVPVGIKLKLFQRLTQLFKQ